MESDSSEDGKTTEKKTKEKLSLQSDSSFGKSLGEE